MRRLTMLIPLVAVFVLGWSFGASSPRNAEARPKASCKDDLALTRSQLATARADVAAARAETAAARREVDRLLAAERRRVQMLEEQIGTMVKELR